MAARDATDARILDTLVNRTGQIINSPADVGGYETYDPGAAPVDTDQDGLPDSWEQANGLNPNDPGDATTDSGNGYDYLEVYVNGLIEG